MKLFSCFVMRLELIFEESYFMRVWVLFFLRRGFFEGLQEDY